MKKLLSFAWIPLILLFMYSLGQFTAASGTPYWYNTFILLLAYMLWLLMIALPTLAAFGFQCFVCNTAKSLLLRLIPTLAVLAILVYECIHPFYGVLFGFLSHMLGITQYIIIPVILLGLTTGWFVKPKQDGTK